MYYQQRYHYSLLPQVGNLIPKNLTGIVEKEITKRKQGERLNKGGMNGQGRHLATREN